MRLFLGSSMLLAILIAPDIGNAVPLAQSSSLASVKRVMADAPQEQDIATPRLPRK